MHIKNLFTVPEGEKITEKLFGRALVSSVCGILLCMACLVGTTWAWFVAGVESVENVIAIAAVLPDTAMSKQGASIAPTDYGSYALEAGKYYARVALKQEETAQADTSLLENSQRPVYVIMTVEHSGQTQYRLFTFDNRSAERNTWITVADGTATVSFSASWVKPDTPISEDDGQLAVGTEPAQITTPVTQPPVTEPSAEATTAPATEPSQEETEATQQTTESTETSETETVALATETVAD